MAHSTRKNAKKKAAAGGAKYTTRNQQRKRDYAAKALAEQNKRGVSHSVAGTSSKAGARLRKTNHKRGHEQLARDARKAEAKARAAEYSNLTPLQKIEKLDKRLGKGLGAVKERVKLLKLSLQKDTKPLVHKVEIAVRSDKVHSHPHHMNKQAKKEAHDKKVREARNGR